MSVANANVFVSLISTSLAVLKILLNELMDNSTYKVISEAQLGSGDIQ